MLFAAGLPLGLFGRHRAGRRRSQQRQRGRRLRRPVERRLDRPGRSRPTPATTRLTPTCWGDNRTDQDCRRLGRWDGNIASTEGDDDHCREPGWHGDQHATRRTTGTSNATISTGPASDDEHGGHHGRPEQLRRIGLHAGRHAERHRQQRRWRPVQQQLVVASSVDQGSVGRRPRSPRWANSGGNTATSSASGSNWTGQDADASASGGNIGGGECGGSQLQHRYRRQHGWLRDAERATSGNTGTSTASITTGAATSSNSSTTTVTQTNSGSSSASQTVGPVEHQPERLIRTAPRTSRGSGGEPRGSPPASSLPTPRHGGTRRECASDAVLQHRSRGATMSATSTSGHELRPQRAPRLAVRGRRRSRFGMAAPRRARRTRPTHPRPTRRPSAATPGARRRPLGPRRDPTPRSDPAPDPAPAADAATAGRPRRPRPAPASSADPGTPTSDTRRRGTAGPTDVSNQGADVTTTGTGDRQLRRQHRRRQHRRSAPGRPARRTATQVALLCVTTPTSARRRRRAATRRPRAPDSTGGIAQLTNIQAHRQRPGRRPPGRAVINIGVGIADCGDNAAGAAGRHSLGVAGQAGIGTGNADVTGLLGNTSVDPGRDRSSAGAPTTRRVTVVNIGIGVGNTGLELRGRLRRSAAARRRSPPAGLRATATAGDRHRRRRRGRRQLRLADHADRLGHRQRRRIDHGHAAGRDHQLRARARELGWQHRR